MKLPVHFHSHVPQSGEVREVKPGDVIYFLCNGQGRGGHYSVIAKVTKVNRKTIAATECVRSYLPGTRWTVHQDSANLCIVEQFAITAAEMAGVGVYRFRFSPKPKAKDMKAFKASVTPEMYAKILEEAMTLVDQFPHEYKSALTASIIGFEFKKVLPMSEEEAAMFKKNNPEEAAKVDVEIDQVKKEFPELFKKD